MTTFAGFPNEAFDFFKQLARNNKREWFLAHKDTYERACREPMRELVAEFGVDPDNTWITRINRDLRFSKDKSPYRTNIAAVVRDFYLSLSADGLYVGAGMYKPEPAALGRLRDAIDDKKKGAELAKIVASLKKKGYSVDTHERVASAPRGYAADHPRIELLRMKDIHAGKTLPKATVSSRKTVPSIKRVMSDVKPLVEWLKAHVGARP
jgi:uncharacterized protein (TIGR02453 family)